MTQNPSPRIDLNCDLGEGFGRWTLGDDDALLEIVTSANVACGFHAGDASTLRRVCERAAERGVSIGAQVSYRDLAGFGRRAMDLPFAELRDEVLYQLGALAGFAAVAGTSVRYVKPHGALYNRCFADTEQARAVVTAITEFDSSLQVLGQRDAELLKVATEHGLSTVSEAFADRAYTAHGALVSRDLDGAMITDVDHLVERAVGMALHGTVTSIDGVDVSVHPQSICVHGDTPGAPALARRLKDALIAAGVDVVAFA